VNYCIRQQLNSTQQYTVIYLLMPTEHWIINITKLCTQPRLNMNIRCSLCSSVIYTHIGFLFARPFFQSYSRLGWSSCRNCCWGTFKTWDALPISQTSVKALKDNECSMLPWWLHHCLLDFNGTSPTVIMTVLMNGHVAEHQIHMALYISVHWLTYWTCRCYVRWRHLWITSYYMNFMWLCHSTLNNMSSSFPVPPKLWYYDTLQMHCY